MAVKLIDLQLIYGVAGARERFEDLVSQLVEGEQPDADKVRIEQGDGGIDVYVGDLGDPAGIDVYQCKFFPQGIGEAQKEQIRKSYRTCRDGKRFKTKRWTLCLPVDLSLDEKEWFEDWRGKQAGSGILIEDPWGAMKLEGLLYQEKNWGLKEAFFKEHHLAQIRELHGMMERLLADIAERLRHDATARERDQRTEALALQAEYLSRFLQAMRVSYGALTKPPSVSWSAVQKAKKAGDEEAARAAQAAGKRLGHWEVVIRPSWIPGQSRITTLNECWSVIQGCQVRSNGWEFPVVGLDGRESGHDWIGLARTYGREVESWRLSQRGVFVLLSTVYDDLQSRTDANPRWRGRLPHGFTPERFLDIDVAIRVITHVFRFAGRLADKAFDPGDGVVEVTIRLTDTRDRVLVTRDDPARLEDCYRATADELENTWRCERERLRTQPDRLAVEAAHWFFERFNWPRASEDVLSNVQARIFSHH